MAGVSPCAGSIAPSNVRDCSHSHGSLIGRKFSRGCKLTSRIRFRNDRFAIRASLYDQSYQEKGDARMTAVSVRYIVDNVDAAIEFYTKRLDFRVEIHPAPGF